MSEEILVGKPYMKKGWWGKRQGSANSHANEVAAQQNPATEAEFLSINLSLFVFG